MPISVHMIFSPLFFSKLWKGIEAENLTIFENVYSWTDSISNNRFRCERARSNRSIFIHDSGIPREGNRIRPAVQSANYTVEHVHKSWFSQATDKTEPRDIHQLN